MSNVEDSAARALAELGGEKGKRSASDTEPQSDSNEVTKKRRRKTEQKVHAFPVQPNTIQVIKKPRTYVNHSYRDFSNVPPEDDYVIPTEVSEKTFYQKIYELLSMPGDGKEKKAMDWCVHGRAFSVARRVFHDSSGLLQSYLGHNRYNKFLKQLTNNGFRMITQGRDCGCFYSEVRSILNNACDGFYRRILRAFLQSLLVHASWPSSSYQVRTGTGRVEEDVSRPRKRARLLQNFGALPPSRR
jgi:HSF-type DNA-binding